ncbi:MAG: hypothetical protein HY299_08965 [Verrucomicrobia bacterium]|nr:hypothetical protein [Verrucomicrobiota bacterium]
MIAPIAVLLRSATAIALLACFGATASAMTRSNLVYELFWKLRTDVGTPGPRYGHALAYDSDRGVTVFFGGEYSVIGGDPEYFNDTWEYDGATWRPITTDGPVPDPRSRHAMCYDSALRKVILFGGKNDSAYFNDVWNYESTGPQRGRWIHRSLSLGPGPLAGHTMVYDSFRAVAIVAGGTPDQFVPNHRQTQAIWEWHNDTSQWFLRGEYLGYRDSDLGSGLTGQMMIYDYQRHQALVFGGAGPHGLNIVGSDDGYVITENSVERLRCGPPVSEGAMVYDGYHDMYFGFGGNESGFNRDFEPQQPRPKQEMILWPAYDGFPCFSPPLEVGEVEFDFYQSSILVRPNDRAQCAMVYDEKRRVTVLLGGVGGTRYSDTWELVTRDLREAWVRFNYTGREVGTGDLPFSTIAKGLAGVAPAGTLKINAGSTLETPHLVDPVTIQAIGGPVIIGRR